MRSTILLTGIGGDISQSVAKILRETRPEYRLIGVDIHNQHAGGLFVDHSEVMPSARESNYLVALENIVKKHSVDIVFPLTEPELGACLPFESTASGVQWITAGARVVAVGLDKLETMSAIKQLGIPVPWTVSATDDFPSSYPCIFKSRFGSGSRSVFTVSDRSEAKYLMSKWPEAIFQELLLPSDRELTCAVYRKLDGTVAVLLMLRRLSGGFSGWVKVVHNEEARRMCEAIAEGLDLRGSMNVQLRLTDKGPRVFEINPRISSTVLMRHRIGFSDALWMLDELEGRSIHVPDIPEGQTMVRVQDARICN